jgi:hypothetical protein
VCNVDRLGKQVLDKASTTSSHQHARVQASIEQVKEADLPDEERVANYRSMFAEHLEKGLGSRSRASSLRRGRATTGGSSAQSPGASRDASLLQMRQQDSSTKQGEACGAVEAGPGRNDAAHQACAGECGPLAAEMSATAISEVPVLPLDPAHIAHPRQDGAEQQEHGLVDLSPRGQAGSDAASQVGVPSQAPSRASVRFLARLAPDSIESADTTGHAITAEQDASAAVQQAVATPGEVDIHSKQSKLLAVPAHLAPTPNDSLLHRKPPLGSRQPSEVGLSAEAAQQTLSPPAVEGTERFGSVASPRSGRCATAESPAALGSSVLLANQPGMFCLRPHSVCSLLCSVCHVQCCSRTPKQTRAHLV